MTKLTRLIVIAALAAGMLPAIAGPIFSGEQARTPLALRAGETSAVATPGPRTSAIKPGWGAGPDHTAIAEPGVLLLLGAGLLAAGLARK